MNRRRSDLRLIPTAERELYDHLGAMPDDEVECRAGHHEFELDRWRIGKPVPASVYARPAKDGYCDLVSPCMNCGAKLLLLARSDGTLDFDAPRRIDYPGTWYHLPSHLPRGKRVLRRERFRRGGAQQQVRGLILAMAAREPGQPTGRRAAPSVRFQGA